MNTTLKRLALLALLVLAIGAVLSTVQPRGPTFTSSPYSPVPTSPLPTPTPTLQALTPTLPPTHTPTPSHWYDECSGAPQCAATPVQPTYTPQPTPTCYPTPACPWPTRYPTSTPYPPQPTFAHTTPHPSVTPQTPEPTATTVVLTQTPLPAGCTHIVSPGDVIFDATGMSSGSTICLDAGEYTRLAILNAHGTAEQPITVRNESGRVRVSGSTSENWVYVTNCQHVRLTGTGVKDLQYGFLINSVLRVMDQSRHIEIDHVEITDRMDIKDDEHPDFEMTDIHIHHCYLHGQRGRNEAIYVGSSFYDDHPDSYLMRRVEIDHNRLEDVGGEGIQVGSCVEDCTIHHNTMTNVVANPDLPEKLGSAIMGNAGTNAEVYNNVIVQCRGPGIFVHGDGAINIYNNLIVDTATLRSQYDAITILDTGSHVYNNTIIGANRHGIRFASQMTGHVAYNNIVLGTGGASIVDDWRAGDVHHNHTKEDGYTPENYGFANPAAGNYHPKPACAGIDTGADIALAFDLDDNPRPQGDGYDIGCYESSPTLWQRVITIIRAIRQSLRILPGAQ